LFAVSIVIVPFYRYAMHPFWSKEVLDIIENARHCGASPIKNTRRTWSSYRHVLRPQKITKYTRVHKNCESGLVIIYKHAAHRLVHHRLQVVETAWTDDSTLVWSPVTNTGTVSQATKTNRIDRLPCSYDIALATE